MGKVVEKIEDNEYFEFKGDVTVTGNIGKNATVIIKDGSLTVNGDVGKQSEITISESQSNNVVVSSGTFFSFSGNSVVFSGSHASLVNIKGSIGSNVSIKTSASDVKINGEVGEHLTVQTKSGNVTLPIVPSYSSIKTMSGDVYSGNVHSNVQVKTMSGDITVNNVNDNSSLNTMSGDIAAQNISDNTVLKTMSGDINVVSASDTATLTTMSGDIYENGIKQRKERSSSSHSTISIGGMSFMGGVSGRVIVNGRDITDLISASQQSSQPSNEQEPVRYYKGM